MIQSVYDERKTMKLLCKMFWHRMVSSTACIASSSKCTRCRYTENAIKWPRTPPTTGVVNLDDHTAGESIRRGDMVKRGEDGRVYGCESKSKIDNSDLDSLLVAATRKT